MALGILFILVSVVPGTILARGIGDLASEYDDAVGVWTSSHVMGLAILTVVWILALRPHGEGISSLGLGLPRFPLVKLILVTLGILGTSLVATALYSAMVRLGQFDFLIPPDIPSEISFPGPAVVFTFQALSVWTPLTEEIFFRGFIFAGLVPRLGIWRAMAVSALTFSLFHLSPGLIVPVFITGFLLAWLYRRTGSLWPGIVAHGGQNTLAVLAITYWV